MSENNAAARDIGLYVHIPFCRSKCNYCSFFSAPPKSEEEMDRYTEALVRHLQIAKFLVEDRIFSSVYLGGGTPSLLGPSRIIRILEAVHQNLSLRSDVEVTLEANPESADQDLFRAFHNHGGNRVSLGAQSFHNDELANLGRIHSVDQIQQSIESIRSAGIHNLSLDLIFALPNQTLDGWRDNLRRALHLHPDHISAYGLSFEEETPLGRLYAQGKITPVLDEIYVQMYDWARYYMKEQGWNHYEISNWSQPGRQSRHNRLYWNREEYLAVGAAAHGMIGLIRYSFIQNAAKYVNVILKMKDGAKSGFWHPDLVQEKIELTMDEMASDFMVFGLRQMDGISIKAFQNRFGFNPADRWGDALSALIARGWVEQQKDRMRLTYCAVPISNEVFVHFLD